MKISNITCFPVWSGRNYLFVVVDTDEGLYGVGEAGVSSRILSILGAIEHFKPLLIGQDATRIEHLWQMLSRGGFFPHDNILGSAIAAIDIALWDIRGKALGVPVYELLGGRVRDKVACYCHLSAGDKPGGEGLLANAKERVAEGWKFVRWSLPTQGDLLEPRRAVRQAIAQFAAMREALGDEVELCFDVHTRLSPADAILFCQEVARYRPFFIEDPIRSESPEAFRLLRQKVDVPLAAGEQFCSKWQFRELIDRDLIDYARIDLCIAAGLTEAKKIAGWCEGHYIDIVVHNPLGPVSTAVCAHFNFAIPNFGVQEQARVPGSILPDVVTGQPLMQGGDILPPTAPGLGIAFNREAAAAHPFQMTRSVNLHREDGSFTNW